MALRLNFTEYSFRQLMEQVVNRLDKETLFKEFTKSSKFRQTHILVDGKVIEAVKCPIKIEIKINGNVAFKKGEPDKIGKWSLGWKV